jgi:hypothetical protein
MVLANTPWASTPTNRILNILPDNRCLRAIFDQLRVNSFHLPFSIHPPKHLHTSFHATAILCMGERRSATNMLAFDILPPWYGEWTWARLHMHRFLKVAWLV